MKGNRKGEHEEKVEDVRRYIEKGYGITQIMDITGMSDNEINSIRRKLNEKHRKEYNDII
ncbi:hypothetical protein CLTEP_10440 [Clostridium tepidiprofundi DSM 19306]|uniref:Resolvase HTH domain-containing protein n=1 Tax=Clostridium tepidiprofundi DSM 19306 TaxID=1121338 RepID=A0A151B557_9CLOT|nr:hypothetical protein [Clostridium tepidiprofundi]KYH35051.1 hypothetical protein CLTEP_10440 [Clostridium tepidiprofundi DSM 19306]